MGQDLGFQLNQNQTQTLSLSQGMRQSILMLQLDAIDLTAYLKDIALENPLIDIKTRLDTPGIPAGATVSYDIKDEHRSLFDYLLEQVQLTMRKTPLRDLVVYLIQQLDPRGFLPLDDDQLVAQLGVSKVMILDAVTLLQRLDPPGVGARDLQECLYLQAEADQDQVPEGVLDLLQGHFDDLVAHRYGAIKAALNLSDTDLNACLAYVQTLSADPGLPYNHTQTEYVVPELRVTIQAGKASLRVNRHGQPELLFAQETYAQLHASNDAEVRRYIRQKRDQYQSLAYAMARRQETLIMIGRAVVHAQFKYFQDPTTPLAPLLLRDIAQQLQLSESTVSRAINGKYIQCDFGVLPLKMFFSRYSPATGDGTVHSTAQLIAALQQLVAQEDPAHPLSDAALAKALAKAGFAVARRTVAKYRAQAKIASAHERKIT